MSFKNSETLLGIETTLPSSTPAAYKGFKNSETLLGIETLNEEGKFSADSEASKTLKPF